MKKSVKDLAIFGGKPEFDEPLHVGRPRIGDLDRVLGEMRKVLESRQLTNDGPKVREFEEKFAELCQVKHAVAVANGTLGLMIAMDVLGVLNSIKMPSWTFIATAHAAWSMEIVPIFCDVDEETHLMMNPHSLGEGATGAWLPVHLWGTPCVPHFFERFTEEAGRALIFDASHAIGCSHNGKMIGGFGDAEVFSLHATKCLHSFEGGMITTNNAALSESMRLMRNFGFDREDHTACRGVNAKMSEIHAVMGLEMLWELEGTIYRNKEAHKAYGAVLSDLPIRFMEQREDALNKRNYQYVVLGIEAEKFGMDRDLLLKILRAENVLARRYFYPGCHRMEPYRHLDPHAGEHLPVTERLAAQTLVLPGGLPEFEPARIAEIMAFAHKHAGEIQCR